MTTEIGKDTISEVYERRKYVVLENLGYDGWSVASTHERKSEAEGAIRQLLNDGKSGEAIRLVSDLSWYVKTKNGSVAHVGGTWRDY